MATNTLRVFLRSPSKLGSQRDGRPAQVVDVTLRPRFVFELCAPRRCHASDHGASGIRLPGLGRGFDDGDALALEEGCGLPAARSRAARRFCAGRGERAGAGELASSASSARCKGGSGRPGRASFEDGGALGALGGLFALGIIRAHRARRDMDRRALLLTKAVPARLR